MAWNLIQATGIVNAINCTIENSIAEGGATFNSFFENGNIDNGGNSGWDFGSRTLYWVGEGGNWNDTGHWSLSSGGEGGENIPSLADNVIFDSNSITLEDQSIIFPSNQISYLKTLDMTDLHHQINLNSNVFGEIKQVSCGMTHTVILTENGNVYAWGNNANRQCNPSSATTPWTDPTTVILSGVKYVACGSLWTLALTENGDLHSWGYNYFKNSNPASSSSPWIDTSTIILSGVKQMAGGSGHTVVLMENGDVHSWGSNGWSQTNPVSSTDPWIDTSTIILSGVKQIACGSSHTVALMENGDIHSWGTNAHRQSNPASSSTKWTDTSTVILSGVKQIACGHYNTIALMENGDVHSWGYNGDKQTNPLSSTDPWIDTSTVILSGVKQISSGSWGTHTVALMENGDVHGWGSNFNKECNPSSDINPWTDTSTIILSGVKQIASSEYNTITLMENGDIYGWGKNDLRQTNPFSATTPWVDIANPIIDTNQIWHISASSGMINANKSTIINSTAEGGASFFALESNENIDGGNNTGWYFKPFIYTIIGDRHEVPLSSIDPEGPLYDFYINWGDGSPIDHITDLYDFDKYFHIYAIDGIHEISITGIIEGFSTMHSNRNIVDIKQWGCFSFKRSDAHFKHCGDLINITATDVPNLNETDTLSNCFCNCLNLLTIPNINNWDVSSVTNMATMFSNVRGFNSDISGWDVSNVEIMDSMFEYCLNFNQPLNNWNTSKVTDMGFMFRNCLNFNQPLNNWNTSKVTDMGFMFYSALSFNQDISMWNISNVTNMYYMFYGSAFSTENYEKLLVGWSAQNVQPNVLFHAGSAKYHAAYAPYKQILLDKGWIITDGGLI